MSTQGKWLVSALLSLVLIAPPSTCIATQTYCSWYPAWMHKLLMPGSIIALMLSGPNHIVSRTVVIGASFIVYLILFYLLLDFWRRVHGE